MIYTRTAGYSAGSRKKRRRSEGEEEEEAALREVWRRRWMVEGREKGLQG